MNIGANQLNILAMNSPPIKVDSIIRVLPIPVIMRKAAPIKIANRDVSPTTIQEWFL